MLEALRVDGACRREVIKQALDRRITPIRACFAEHSGRVSLRFKAYKGQAKGVTRQGKGISRDVDTCLLRLVRATTFPQGAQCDVEAAWSRPTQAQRDATVKRATSVLKASKPLSPEVRGALLKPEIQPAPTPPPKREKAQER